MPTKFPLFRLPKDLELVLHIIRGQLKSRKFFNRLSELGLGDSFYQTDLLAVILRELDMDDGSDEIIEFLSDVIDRHSLEVEEDNESLMKATMAVYVALLQKRNEAVV